MVRGASRRLVPRSRRLSCDVLHFHRQVPICAHDRFVPLRDVDALRTVARERISWPVLMLKACALVAREVPELRRAWLGGLWPTIYEHPESVGMLAIEREFRGERWLFWGRFRSPETTSLTALQARLDQYCQGSVEEQFSRPLQLSAVPNPLRRAIWWWNLNVSGRQRARRLGTFFLTTLASRGTVIQSPPCFHTANFTYGPIEADGQSRLTIAYDHRIMDGAVVAEALARLEETIHGPLTAELRSLAGSAARTECPAA